MLTQREARDLEALLHRVAATLPGFVPRPAQQAMMQAVAQTLDRCRHGTSTRHTDGANLLVCECGTGTGKTLGYLVPSIVLGRSAAKRLVVSSSTVVLQEQLVGKDLPLLQRCLPWPLHVAIAKGRTRYLCPLRLEAELAQGQQGCLPGLDPAQQQARGADTVAVARLMARRFERGTWDGDRDGWDGALAPGLWQRVSTDRHGCAAARCPRFAQCPYFLARQRLREADVIVANHDLLLAALARPPGTVLPEPSDSFYLIDEAHRLAAKAIGHLAQRHAVHAALAGLAGLPALLDATQSLLGLAPGPVQRAGQLAIALAGTLQQLAGWIAARPRPADPVLLRFANGQPPPALAAIGQRLLSHSSALLDVLGDCRAACLTRLAARPGAQAAIDALGAPQRQVLEVQATWQQLLRQPGPREPPPAGWIEQAEGDVRVAAAPLDAGGRIRALLWRRASAAVLTSATLTVDGRFNAFVEQVGLTGLPRLTCLRLPSPFEHQRQARLAVPRLAVAPQEAQAHADEVARRLPALLARGAALVLFTSVVQLQRVLQQLPAPLRVEVLVQGELPQRELLARHRARVDAGQASAIFGLAAFQEGIDLPGRYCTEVVITRLPFPVPVHPWELARAEWWRRCGRSPFHELVLPETCIRFAQAVGRLIRSDQDHGTVTVLDPRLLHRSYGSRLLRSVPAMPLVRDEPAGEPKP